MEPILDKALREMQAERRTSPGCSSAQLDNLERQIALVAEDLDQKLGQWIKRLHALEQIDLSRMRQNVDRMADRMMGDPRQDEPNLLIPPPRRYDRPPSRKQRERDLVERIERLEQIVQRLHGRLQRLSRSSQSGDGYPGSSS